MKQKIYNGEKVKRNNKKRGYNILNLRYIVVYIGVLVRVRKSW